MVNTTCAIRDCMSSSRTNKDIKFHQFPQTIDRIKQWLEVCDRADLYKKPLDGLRHTYVCGLHFEPRMYGNKILKKYAVPTLLLPTKHTFNVATQTDTHQLLKQTIEDNPTFATEIDGRAIIARVYQYLEKEYEYLKTFCQTSEVLEPIANTLQRTATATGICEELITHIMTERLLLGSINKPASDKRIKLYHDHHFNQVNSSTLDASEHVQVKIEAPDEDCQMTFELDPLETQQWNLEDHEETSNTSHEETTAVPDDEKNSQSEDVSEPECPSAHQEKPGVSHDKMKNKTSPVQTRQLSQGSQNIIIETGHHQDQLNTRHTINVILNNNKKERQRRYREQNRDKLKQREAERRERIQYSQSIAGPSTSSNTNRIELNNEEIVTAQSSSGSEKIQPSSIQRNDQGNDLNALQKKRERQQRYRKQNRDKLKQREAERRRRLQNADVITRFYLSKE